MTANVSILVGITGWMEVPLIEKRDIKKAKIDGDRQEFSSGLGTVPHACNSSALGGCSRWIA